MSDQEKKHQAGAKNEVALNPETPEIKGDIPLSAYTQNHDALNPAFNKTGQGIGTHEVDINQQTDLELGALVDPGGIDPASDQEFLEEMSNNIAKKREES